MNHFIVSEIPDINSESFETFVDTYYDTNCFYFTKKNINIIERFSLITGKREYILKQKCKYYQLFDQKILLDLTPFANIRFHRFYKDDTHWIDVCFWETIKNPCSCYIVGTCRNKQNECKQIHHFAPKKILMYLKTEHPNILSNEEKESSKYGIILNESPFIRDSSSDAENTIEIDLPN